MNDRHAYVILAHNEPRLLEMLVRAIDDERNDIFIHVDAKSDMTRFKGVHTKRSALIWTPRVKTYWGGPSMVKAEMVAFKCALANGEYSRYHLISGTDLPLKSQDYIHEFCDVTYAGKEFVGFDLSADDNLEFRDQWRYYVVLDDYSRLANPIIRKACSFVRRICLSIQRTVGYERRPPFEVKKGTQWVSLTGKMVGWLLTDGKPIFDFLCHSHCADEKLMQTAVWNSPYRANIFDLSIEMRGCMREIDWKRGQPYVWQAADLLHLQRSEMLFARKFSSSILVARDFLVELGVLSDEVS